MLATRERPRRFTLPTCDIPQPAGEVGHHKTLYLPSQVQNLLLAGYDVVRVNSEALAKTIPDYEGKSPGNHSFLPHRDNFGNIAHPMRYLVLSKQSSGARGSSTLTMSDATAGDALPLIERYFLENHESLERSSVYDSRFSISEAEYYTCFKSGGYETVVNQLVVRGVAQTEKSLRLNLLNYLIRGSEADEVMEDVLKVIKPHCFAEEWEQAGVLFIDNARVFHARFGGNEPPLQRNFCISL